MQISEIMTAYPVALPADRPVAEAATAMRDNGIGDVIVARDGRMAGLVTDRDLAIRVLAEGRDPAATTIGEVCSEDIRTLGPDDDVETAVQIVRDLAVRRIPVLADGEPVGIVTIGDLALARDGRSALADLSASPANL